MLDIKIVKRATSARSHSPKPLGNLKEDVLRPRLLSRIRHYLLHELKSTSTDYGQLQIYKRIFDMFIEGSFKFESINQRIQDLCTDIKRYQNDLR